MIAARARVPARECNASDAATVSKWTDNARPREDGTVLAYGWTSDGYQIRRETAPDGSVRYFRKLATW